MTELEEQRASATEHESRNEVFVTCRTVMCMLIFCPLLPQATHRRQLDEWRMKLADSERRVDELQSELSSAHDAKDGVERRLTELADIAERLRGSDETNAAQAQALREKDEQLDARSTELSKVEAELTKSRQQMQQRGDVARRLLAEKDAELETLRMNRPVSGAASADARPEDSRAAAARVWNPPVGGGPLGESMAGPMSSGADEQILALARMQAATSAREVALKAEIERISEQLAARDAELAALRGGEPSDQSDAAPPATQQVAATANAAEPATARTIEPATEATTRTVVVPTTSSEQSEGHDARGGMSDEQVSYLKASVLRFMVSADDAKSKESLSRVISTILHFSPSEEHQVQAAIAGASSTSFGGFFGL